MSKRKQTALDEMCVGGGGNAGGGGKGVPWPLYTNTFFLWHEFFY